MFEGMQEAIQQIQIAVPRVFELNVLGVIVASSLYGIFVGAIPGLTATMAVALVVPLSFFLTDIQAIAAIVTTVVTMATMAVAAMIRLRLSIFIENTMSSLYQTTLWGRYCLYPENRGHCGN